MTPPTELGRCANCDGLFTEASLDDIFYHATACCRRDCRGPFTEPSPTRNGFSHREQNRVR